MSLERFDAGPFGFVHATVQDAEFTPDPSAPLPPSSLALSAPPETALDSLSSHRQGG
ncbi:MAG: hypothetical protein OEW80_03840 [Gemmatimonadota bacterium]|nr:hypothetical protein [Gemmatimonadota bacterium]